MGRPVILATCRTPGGKYGGVFSKIAAPDLGAIAIKEALSRSGLSAEHIEEVVMGNGWQAGVGANPARIAMYRGGIPESVPAYTINKRCGSSVKTAMLISDRIRLGDIKAGIAGGMESASNVPYLLEGARWGYRMGEKPVLDGLHRDGFMCPLAEMLMGATGEILAQEHSISREEQDSYAFNSHRKASEAIASGKFSDEIVAVKIKDRKKGEIIVDTDEIPRADTTIDKLAKLPPVFAKDGTITAGSSSALCDGASAMVIADGDWATSMGYKPLAEITGYGSAALDPRHMGLGPVHSTPKALAMAGVTLDDVDLIELNEAFAAQVLAVHRSMPFDMDRCNIYGGAIALGHPIGATGAKLIATMVHGLIREDKEIGLVTACIGGGQGVSMVIKRL